MTGWVDLHAHVLPAVDDGPPDVAAAVALCRAMADAGVTAVAATSHVSDAYPNRAEHLAEVRGRLRDTLFREGIVLDVLRGAEIALEQIAALGDNLDSLALGDGPWLLIESPLSPSVVDVEMLVSRLLTDGRKVVLAHPERSPAFQRDPDQLMRLVASGALCAVTVSAVDGSFGRIAKRFARQLLVAGAVHVLTSDAHDLAGRRPELAEPLAGAAAEMPGLDAVLPWLLRDAPAAILRGDAPGPPPGMVDPAPDSGSRRGWRRLLRR